VINRKIARRYAKALHNIGLEDGNYDRYLDELEAFTALVEGHSDLREVLINPAFSPDSRQAILKTLVQRMALDRITANFLLILAAKNRMRYLPDVTAMYQELADETAGRARVEVVTAFELSQTKLDTLVRALEDVIKKTIVVQVQQDPALIGGVVAKIGGTVYDGSVKTQLEDLRELLAKG
jgi:F-type H+-transporting ATPase subunit delta